MIMLSIFLQSRDLKIDIKRFKMQQKTQSEINSSVRNDLNSLYFHSGHQKVILYPIICIDCLWNYNALCHKPGCSVINICTILLVFFFLLSFIFSKTNFILQCLHVEPRFRTMTMNSKYLQTQNRCSPLWVMKNNCKTCAILYNLGASTFTIIYRVIINYCDFMLKQFIENLIMPFKSQQNVYSATYSTRNLSI